MELNIEERAIVPLIEEDDAIYEELNQIITKCILKSENKYRKLYMGVLLFSPGLVIHLNLITLSHLIIRKKKGNYLNMKTIIRLQTSTKITGKPLELELIEMYQKYKESIYNYYKFRKIVATIRTTFQDKWIGELVLSVQTEASGIQEKIKNLEVSRF